MWHHKKDHALAILLKFALLICRLQDNDQWLVFAKWLIEENMIFKVTLQQLVNASYITSVCSSLIPECLHDVLDIFRCWIEPSFTWVIMTSAA